MPLEVDSDASKALSDSCEAEIYGEKINRNFTKNVNFSFASLLGFRKYLWFLIT